MKKPKSYNKKKTTSSQEAKEPSMVYSISNPFDRLEILNTIEGTNNSTKLIKSLLDKTKLPISFLAEKVFEVTAKTLSLYKNKNTTLPARFTELSTELSQLYELGIEVFGDVATFNTWIYEPSYGLNNRIPAQMLNTSTGISLVFEELKRIEFGATA